MIHRIKGATLGGAGTISGTITNRTLNGLLIGSDRPLADDDYISVTLNSPHHTPKVIANRLPLAMVAGVSDLMGGLAQRVQEWAQNTDDPGASAPTDWFTASLDLGCLKMEDNESTLEVEVNAGAAGSFSIGSYFDEDGKDVLLKYTRTQQFTDMHRNVDKIFLYKSTPVTDPITEDVNVLIESPHGQVQSTFPELATYAFARRAIEASVGIPVVQLYEAPDALGDSVTYNVTGDLTGYSLLAVSVERDWQRVSRGVIGSIERLRARVSKKDAEEQKALRRSGLVPRLNQIGALARSLNVD